MTERNKKNRKVPDSKENALEKISLKTLAEACKYGETFSFESDGIHDYEDEEYGKSYVLGNDKQIMFVSFGFEGRESILHKQFREVIEANPTIVDHRFKATILLHRPSKKKFRPYWTLKEVAIMKDVKAEYEQQQKTIVNYI